MGYLLKSSLGNSLLDTIRAVYAGKRVIPEEVAGEIGRHAADDALSTREVEVLCRVAAGQANKSIARDLGISESKKFVEAMGGEEGMQKLDTLFGEAVDASHSELFVVNPKQSYVEDSWIKADPDFWKPRAGGETAAAKPAAKASAAKPAGQ